MDDWLRRSASAFRKCLSFLSLVESCLRLYGHCSPNCRGIWYQLGRWSFYKLCRGIFMDWRCRLVVVRGIEFVSPPPVVIDIDSSSARIDGGWLELNDVSGRPGELYIWLAANRAGRDLDNRSGCGLGGERRVDTRLQVATIARNRHCVISRCVGIVGAERSRRNRKRRMHGR